MSDLPQSSREALASNLRRIDFDSVLPIADTYIKAGVNVMDKLKTGEQYIKGQAPDQDQLTMWKQSGIAEVINGLGLDSDLFIFF